MKTYAFFMGTVLLVLVASAGLAANPAVTGAGTPPDLPKFAPLAGTTGYQEIQLANDTWYLGFYGTRSHRVDLIEHGWAARAAQLCAAMQRGYFVQLRYVTEPVLAAGSS